MHTSIGSGSKVLIIQTAFLGDVILATGLVETLQHSFPGIKIDFLLRKGNESLLANHPFINRTIILEKKDKTSEFWRLLKIVRKKHYDAVINLHRFAFSGIITGLSGAKFTAGFDKNPFSFLFTKKVKHILEVKPQQEYEANFPHETDRNHSVLSTWVNIPKIRPRLYPAETDFEVVKPFQDADYICIAPASIWKTKRLTRKKWKELVQSVPEDITVYLLGSADDKELNQSIIINAKRLNVVNMAGKLSLLQSGALMQGAKMNYVNDSGPLHIASAMNAPVKAFFLSTLPQFGFGPLSDNATVVEYPKALACRPCGIHGRNACPAGHFKCADIEVEKFTSFLQSS